MDIRGYVWRNEITTCGHKAMTLTLSLALRSLLPRQVLRDCLLTLIIIVIIVAAKCDVGTLWHARVGPRLLRKKKDNKKQKKNRSWHGGKSDS